MTIEINTEKGTLIFDSLRIRFGEYTIKQPYPSRYCYLPEFAEFDNSTGDLLDTSIDADTNDYLGRDIDEWQIEVLTAAIQHVCDTVYFHCVSGNISGYKPLHKFWDTGEFLAVFGRQLVYRKLAVKPSGRYVGV